MEELINKPRVFLSHSKKNSEFIERLANDLRKCQIEPWLDTDQIRHGKSWQDSIFELGLPTCDAIIVYFTEISIQSAIVKKEIDVGLLQNLKDNNIAFLPYVSRAELRVQLRSDIQALQVPEWNDENYPSLLPRVVAEIWRSYLERTVSAAIRNERLKRIEAEFELEKYKNQSANIFSPSEQKEFEYIWNAFNRKYPFYATKYTRVDDKERGVYMKETIACNFNFLLSEVFSLLNNLFADEYVEATLIDSLNKQARHIANVEDALYDQLNLRHEQKPNITDELLTHGLVESKAFNVRNEGREYYDTVYLLTNKYFRFRYWLVYNEKLLNHDPLQFVELS